KRRLQDRVGHPASLQPILDRPLCALQREVDVDVRKRYQDEVLDARGLGGVDEVQLSLLVDALDGITLLARQGRRRSRDDRTNATARSVQGAPVLQVPDDDVGLESLQLRDFVRVRSGADERSDGLSFLGKQSTDLAAQDSGRSNYQIHGASSGEVLSRAMAACRRASELPLAFAFRLLTFPFLTPTPVRPHLRQAFHVDRGA